MDLYFSSANIKSNDLIQKYIGRFSNEISRNILPVYLILTELAYPMGGGEAFLYDTIYPMLNAGYIPIWFSFRKEVEGRPKTDEIIMGSNNCIFHLTSLPYIKDTIKYAINLYKPRLIHCQGHVNCLMKDVLLETKIPTLIGYHFWNGLLEIREEGNIHMIENHRKNKISKVYTELSRVPFVVQYVVSDFMNDVLRSSGFPTINTIIYPISAVDKYLVGKYNPDRKYVTMINIHKIKGGEIFLSCIKESNPDIKFLAIRSENGSEKLDKEIQAIFKLHSDWKYLTYADIKSVYSESRIVLIPSLADETFCRVAFEAASNSIPIITTGNGFIRKLLGDSAIYPGENPDQWVKELNSLYFDRERLLFLSGKVKDQVYDYEHARSTIKDTLISISKMSKESNIGIYCPWGDQGLGIQCRYYFSVLTSMKFRVSIFSYRSYFTDKPRLQNNPSEWEIPIGSGTIYYSLNDREAVTNMELKNFITSNNIGIFIIPEICWKPIFDKTRYIKSLGVKVFAVPNIEIVIKKEIPEYGIFDKVLCNTKVCMDLLKKESSRLKLEYIGHGIDRMFPPNKTKLISGSIIEFVHVSGYNAIIRKQTHRILEAFQKLKNKNYHLKIFCQELPDELTRNIPDNTEIIAEKLPYRDVIRLYSECHISIQVSSHEGLGLGFYESIAQGTPVISLNTPPHNEVIINGVSGWLLPCTYGKLSDNKDAVIDEAFFKVEDLVTLIDHLLETPSEIDMVQNSTFKYYKDNWTTQTFTKRFVNSLIDP